MERDEWRVMSGEWSVSLGASAPNLLTAPQGVQQHQALSDFQTELDLFADKRVGNRHRDCSVLCTRYAPCGRGVTAMC